MTSSKHILNIAIPVPLRCLFDYLPPVDNTNIKLKPGMRVSIPFGKNRQAIGVIVSISDKSNCPRHKLKRINHVIDQEVVIEPSLFSLIIWASRYYHHPIGEVIFHCMPAKLRKDKPYIEKELIEKINLQNKTDINSTKESKLTLNREQKIAIHTVNNSFGKKNIFLLEGPTGSGKTEVYMAIIDNALKLKKQAMVLVPEIGLTPHFIQYFKERFDCPIAIQHSGLSENKRLQSWYAAKSGKARIILGTRSAIWLPLFEPGVYIIDEEHDSSYKQQEGFRYSAKDTLIIRSTKDRVPIVLGSATPSMESLHNINNKKYTHIKLSSRAGSAKLPVYKLIDIRGKKMHGPLSQVLVDEIKLRLQRQEQTLLFLNRRGYAINLCCHQCGWKMICKQCDVPYTFHKTKNSLICHHCNSNKRVVDCCPECSGKLSLLGSGTEKIEEILANIFPHNTILRIDKDSTRKKQSMETILNKIHQDKVDILVGTQMLTKGHHFPNVTLTAIINADHGIFSTDFKTHEKLAQLFIQVGGRAGRGEKKGTVIIQTYNPEHQLFNNLLSNGYHNYAMTLLEERKSASLPPYTYMALLRTRARHMDEAKKIAEMAANLLKEKENKDTLILGPVPALIEKRRGLYQQQLIIQSNKRSHLHKHLNEWLLQFEKIKLPKGARWSLDIDPQDMT